MTFDSSKLKLILIAILAAFAALYLGIAAATAQFEAIAWVAGGSTLVVCILLGRKIWLLIPFLGMLSLTLKIPGTPTSLILAQLLFIGFALIMLLMRKLPFRFRFSIMEIALLTFVICVVQVYLRNPVGVSLFGGATVGGRAYFLFALAAVACFLLCGLRVPPSELRTALKLSILGGILNFVMGVVGLIFPRFGVWFGTAVVTSNPNTVEGVMASDSRAIQLTALTVIPITLARWVSSLINPIKACLSSKWAPIVLLSVVFAAASGFRNVVGAVGLTYLVGLYYQGSFFSVVVASFLGVVAIAVVAIFNAAMPLPANIQRSSAFLPGTWEEQYVRNTEGSTNWRVEMWKEALLTDRWIQNKTLGDGLGLTARELNYQMALVESGKFQATGISGLDFVQEFFMASGDYHSGPVSAIRTIGYVGLLIMAWVQIVTAIHAHRLIIRCRGTEWFPVALFFGIPTIWFPAFFWLVFGAFNLDSIAMLTNLGFIRILENNLPLPAYTPSKRIPFMLSQRRNELTKA